ncbi:MAG: hypothetical protein MZV63_21455 [Marinilabiliales bacterium]|nr:hypothetical protein [Marinilabiliales bacterium]
MGFEALREVEGASESDIRPAPDRYLANHLNFRLATRKTNHAPPEYPNVAVNVISRVELSRPEYENYKAAFKQAAEKFQGRSAMIIGTCDEAADYQISCSPLKTQCSILWTGWQSKLF